MRQLRIVIGACAVLAGGPAAAADLAVYPAAPPLAGSPIYSGHSMVTGDVSLALGYFSFGSADTGEAWGTGRVNIPFGGGLNEQVELSGLGGFEKNSYYTYGVYSHSYWKSPQAAAGLLLGGFQPLRQWRPDRWRRGRRLPADGKFRRTPGIQLGRQRRSRLLVGER